MTLSIRKASLTDLDDIFNLTNDPVVRLNSFSTEPILLKNHKKWFNTILSDKLTLFYVIHDSEKFVAQIRYKKKDKKKCEISISITELYRGKHVGKQCLILSLIELKKEWDIKKIIAEVKEENYVSINFFLKNNFTFINKYIKDKYSVLVFERE